MKRGGAGPRLLDRDDLLVQTEGWYLPRGATEWTSVAEHRPTPSVGDRCWWSLVPPPGDGFRVRREVS